MSDFEISNKNHIDIYIHYIMSILGIFLSSLLIGIYLRYKTIRTFAFTLVFNLSIADFIYHAAVLSNYLRLNS